MFWKWLWWQVFLLKLKKSTELKRKSPGKKAEKATIMIIRKIAVIGAGLMGHGITQAVAQTIKCDVYMCDVAPELLDKGLKQIKNNLDRLLEKKEISPAEIKQVLSRIHPVTDLREAIADADLIIEAVTENKEVKAALITKVDKIAKPTAFIVSNTSSVRISELALATRRPERFAGMHFFNPPQSMKLVEVIRGSKTSDDTIDIIVEVAKMMGKEPIIVNKDTAGFIVNRILILALNEAAFLVEEGIASPEDIDKAIKLGLNWPMGPLALLDYIGEDTALAISEVLKQELGAKYSPSPILEKMVKKGHLGRKTGKGFYDWKTKP
jgi:3-hydroxybutyryl-CoA dehydrogenase